MVRARTWNLRLNLDLFNSGFAALDDERDRSEFLTGLYKGMNGGRVKDDCSDPMSVGFALGEEMRGEAEGFREKSIKNGAKRKSNKNDQTVDRSVVQTVDQPGTQSTIHNPQSLNENPGGRIACRGKKPLDQSLELPRSAASAKAAVVV